MSRRITVQFIGDASSLNKATDSAVGATGRLSDKMRKVAKVAGFALGAGAVIAAKGLYEATKAAAEDEASQARLKKTLENTAKATDEPVWQLPLERKYRKQLDSDIADISNLGGPHAGATTAALFLDEFVAGVPWAHIDIAGTMASDADDAWRSAGATGFGARLLAQLAAGFSAPAGTD